LIDILKKRLEKKIGTSITNRGDCELLSNIILEVMDIEISFNTLRRLYGIIPSTNPNKKTLNTLAQFLGYKNYSHFTQNYNYKEKIDLTEIIYNTLAENDPEEIINIVNKTKNNNQDFITMIIILIRELWHNENYNLINRIFKLKALDFNSFSYFEVLKLGNTIGLLIRAKSNIPPKLLSNINFLECIFLIFVDYSSLNKYYGDALKVLRRNNIRYDITLFTTAVLEFRSFLNNKSTNEMDFDIIYKAKLHPILSGRLLSLKLLDADLGKTKEIIKTHRSAFKGEYSWITHFYELFTTSILLRNTEIMSYLIEKVSVKINFHYQKNQLNSFYLMCLFYYKLIGDIKNEKKYLKIFKLSYCRESYKDFITLLYHVYLFNSSKNKIEKNKLKNKYINISEKLNYPFFSEDFLLNYFK
jgi:hypothetical protein